MRKEWHLVYQDQMLMMASNLHVLILGDRIISFTNAYHGSTFGSLSMSAISLNMRKHYPFSTVSIIFHSRCSSHNLIQLKNIWLLKEMFAKYVPAEEVACIVVETIQGDVVPVPGYFEAFLCHQHGILIEMISNKDLVVRHMEFCIAFQDLITGKSLAGGLPMSAIVGRKDIMESLVSSFGTN